MVSGCVSFASLIRNPIGIVNFEATKIICKITGKIKNFKSVTKKNKNEHDKVVSLPKTKLNSVDVLTSKASFNANNSRDKFVSINNEYDEMNKETNTCNKKYVWCDKINISLRKFLLQLIMKDQKIIDFYKCFWPLIV